ncbi:MAG: Rib/alpha-like domain-containing protein, partial [Flaviflexus sp.]|nr:Rib/alpha-like domain-containing protein [Flaviflexus sp.]
MSANNANAAPATKDWELPANAKLKDTAIIQSGVSFNEVTAPDAFEMGITYRALSSPYLDWIYLRIDEDLAPYIESMSIKQAGGAAASYERHFEKVEPGMGGKIRLSGKLYGPEDPYANDGNVWRVLNDRKSATHADGLLCNGPFDRQHTCGNWGVFNDVPLESQQLTGLVKVKLNAPIDQIVAETGRDEFHADSRWQKNATEPGDDIIIDDFAETTGAVIYFGERPELPALTQNDTWITAQTFHRVFYGYGDAIMGDNQEPIAPPKDSATLRFSQVQPHRIASYNTSTGKAKKPYELHYQIQPEVVNALKGDAIIWQAYSQRNLNEAGGKPVHVPKESFTPEGRITLTTDTTREGQLGYIVVDDVSRYLNRTASEPVNSATVIDLPVDEDMLVPDRSDPKNYTEIHVGTWFTDANDALVRHSFANSYFHLHPTEAPVITNISAGNASDGDDLTTTNEVRETQNFIQGTAVPNAEVTILKVTNYGTAEEDREVIVETVADDSGAWGTKLCEGDGCETPTFADLGITADGNVTLVAIAHEYLTASSSDVVINVTDVPTNDPVTEYTDDAPLAKDATAIEGTLGKQFQNTTSTVVTAYLKSGDELTELGSSDPVDGDINGGQPFSIPVSADQLANCPDIVLMAVESTHPKDPSAPMPTAKDDAYSPSNEVMVPVCERVTVTFDLNGGTADEAIDPVSVVKGDALEGDFPATEPTKDGYKFKGWATTPDATEGDFDETTVVDADTTVYAAWSTDAIDWGNENGDDEGNLVTVDTTYDYGQELTDDDIRALVKNHEKLPADAVVTVSPDINTSPTDEPGHKQTVDVTVTFADGSTLTAPVNITIRPAADKYDPVAEDITVELNAQPTQEQIDAAVSDSEGREFPDGTSFELTEPVDTSTVGTKPAEITVTYPDGSSEVIPVNIIVEDNRTDAEKYDPVAEDITVPLNTDPTQEQIDAAVSDSEGREFPDGTSFELTKPVDTSTPGTKEGEITVTYPDGSSEVIPVNIVVVDDGSGNGDDMTDADKYDPEPNPVEVEVGGT